MWQVQGQRACRRVNRRGGGGGAGQGRSAGEGGGGGGGGGGQLVKMGYGVSGV